MEKKTSGNEGGQAGFNNFASETNKNYKDWDT